MNKYFRVKIFDIKYDTDGEEIDLPQEILVWVREDCLDSSLDDDLLGDLISDETGFCHLGYKVESTDTTIESDTDQEFFI